LEIDMHRNRILMFFALAFGMALALPSTASATVPLGYVQLSGSNLQDSTGTLLANATISFAPVNNAGQPISYQVNGHGQAMFIPVYALVTNGAFTVLIADSSLTNPVNVCYSVSVVNNVSGQSVLGGGYNCLQPSGSGLAVTGGNPWCTAAGSYGGTCNFDLYVPNEAGLVVEQPGTPGATGHRSWTGRHNAHLHHRHRHQSQLWFQRHGDGQRRTGLHAQLRHSGRGAGSHGQHGSHGRGRHYAHLYHRHGQHPHLRIDGHGDGQWRPGLYAEFRHSRWPEWGWGRHGHERGHHRAELADKHRLHHHRRGHLRDFRHQRTGQLFSGVTQRIGGSHDTARDCGGRHSHA
jgi:hypothetical protein